MTNTKKHKGGKKTTHKRNRKANKKWNSRPEPTETPKT